MPRDTKRQQLRERLLKAYLKFQKSSLQYSRHHNTHRQHPIYSASYAGGHTRTLSPLPLQSSVQVDSDSSLSETSSSKTSDNDSLGSEGSWTSEDLDGELFATELDAVLEDMPELLPASYPDSDDEESGEELDNQSEPDSDSSSEINSGHEADDEAMLDDDGIGLGPRLARYVWQSIDESHTTYQSLIPHLKCHMCLKFSNLSNLTIFAKYFVLTRQHLTKLWTKSRTIRSSSTNPKIHKFMLKSSLPLDYTSSVMMGMEQAKEKLQDGQV